MCQAQTLLGSDEAVKVQSIFGDYRKEAPGSVCVQLRLVFCFLTLAVVNEV